jgi:hypothetical protein
MSQTDSTPASIDLYLPAVFRPSSLPGPIEQVVTAPFRRERAARSRAD